MFFGLKYSQFTPAKHTPGTQMAGGIVWLVHTLGLNILLAEIHLQNSSKFILFYFKADIHL